MNSSIPNKYDLGTFLGRYYYFREVTNWRLCLKSNLELEGARQTVIENSPATHPDLLWSSKCLYDSAYHPDTGDKQNVFGRMCFQVPGGMFLTGAMLTFYKTNTAVIFWQWANQSFNAFVNYTNRNANSKLSTTQMGTAYFSATSVAIFTALGLKKILSFRASPVTQRFVPFLAVVAANCVNIPLMRRLEITEGVQLFDDQQNEAAKSKVAAVKGIGQVVVSRNAMAGPGMIVLPLIMNKLEKIPLVRKPAVNICLQTLAIGWILTYMTPASCALFKQKCCIACSTLKVFDPEAFKELNEKYGDDIPKHLYFNKGL